MNQYQGQMTAVFIDITGCILPIQL